MVKRVGWRSGEGFSRRSRRSRTLIFADQCRLLHGVSRSHTEFRGEGNIRYWMFFPQIKDADFRGSILAIAQSCVGQAKPNVVLFVHSHY